MTLEQVIPIIEGKLYAYGMLRLKYPDAPIAQYEEHVGRQESRNTTSPQERWVTSNAWLLHDAAVIERTLKRMSKEQRILIRMRYIEYYKWDQIAKKLHVARRTVFRFRDQIIAILAYEFGLLKGEKVAF